MRSNPAEKILGGLDREIQIAERIVTSTTPTGLRVKPLAEEMAGYLAASGIDNGSSVHINGTTYILVVDDYGDFGAASAEAIRVSLRTERDRITLRAPDVVLARFEEDIPAIARGFEAVAAKQLARDVRQLMRETKGDMSPLPERIRHRVGDYVAEHPVSIRNVGVIAVGGGIMAAIMISGYPVVAAIVGVGITWFIRDVWDTQRTDRKNRDEAVAVRRQLSPIRRQDAILCLGSFAARIARDRTPLQPSRREELSAQLSLF